MEFLRSAFELLGISKRQAGPASVRTRLKQDKLSDPGKWQGYLLFISATPFEGEFVNHDRLSDFYPSKSLRNWEENTSTSYASFDGSRLKLIYYIAFRYDMTLEDSHVVSS